MLKEITQSHLRARQSRPVAQVSGSIPNQVLPERDSLVIMFVRFLALAGQAMEPTQMMMDLGQVEAMRRVFRIVLRQLLEEGEGTSLILDALGRRLDLAEDLPQAKQTLGQFRSQLGRVAVLVDEFDVIIAGCPKQLAAQVLRAGLVQQT